MIQLWMAGGPTQTDTWDPKPNAGEDFTGPLRRTIPTNVTGIQIGELLPLSAKQADKYTIIRGMTHGNNAHEVAAYIMQTGSMPTAELVYPAIGAIVALKKGEQQRPAALHHAHQSARTLQRSRLPGQRVQDLRARRRPQQPQLPRAGPRAPARHDRAAHQRAPLPAEIGGRPRRARSTSTKSTGRWTSSSRRPTA